MYSPWATQWTLHCCVMSRGVGKVNVCDFIPIDHLGTSPLDVYASHRKSVIYELHKIFILVTKYTFVTQLSINLMKH